MICNALACLQDQLLKILIYTITRLIKQKTLFCVWRKAIFDSFATYKSECKIISRLLKSLEVADQVA